MAAWSELSASVPIRLFSDAGVMTTALFWIFPPGPSCHYSLKTRVNCTAVNGSTAQALVYRSCQPYSLTGKERFCACLKESVKAGRCIGQARAAESYQPAIVCPGYARKRFLAEL